MNETSKPLVVATGAAGGIGTALTRALRPDYMVVCLDLKASTEADDSIEVDLTSDSSVELALHKLVERHGRVIDSVVHLAAYFDFTGEEHPLYRKVNVEGTRRLLRALQDCQVGQFVYSGTMLVHAPAELGARIDESTPLAPKWAYPQSKAAAEEAIRKEHGDIPYVLLRLAGVYDDRTAVPTLANQIARIYERDLTSHLYAGDLRVGQSMIHRNDMIDAFRRTIDRRGSLPPDAVILVGEPDAVGYDALQDRIGRLLHGDDDWETMSLPKPVARIGAWVQQKSEPVVPDAIDQGEEPFIRPFMIGMADDHYALDIRRARTLLGWEPRHFLAESLPRLIQSLKDDPLGWYRANKVTPPEWLETADEAGADPEDLRRRHEDAYRREHARHIWAHFLNLGMASWLITAPPLLGHDGTALAWSDIASGCVLLLSAFASLSWRLRGARWVSGAIGVWLLFAPLVFWTGSAAAYTNDTLVGALVIGFALLTPPTPGISPVAALTGPEAPPGWSLNPSSWSQRLSIIALAFVGLYVSRYLAAYQLGQIDGVWEPFFAGGPDPKNGTEEIITSAVSEWWPIPDAGLGAVTYILEILTGMLGSTRRWRTMPWLVVAFGIMIVPLGIVSITFIIIQPIVIGTWCTLCLLGAAAMLLQIPYSVDELVATGQFLARRKKAGQNLLRVFFVGDTDTTAGAKPREDDRPFERPPGAVLADIVGGGVRVTWTLALSIALGLWLMFTRLTLGAEGAMANADHLIGALVITVSVTAFAEVARPVRFLNMSLGAALLFTPFLFAAGTLATLVSIACGLALIALSIPRGPVRERFGGWNRLIV